MAIILHGRALSLSSRTQSISNLRFVGTVRIREIVDTCSETWWTLGEGLDRAHATLAYSRIAFERGFAKVLIVISFVLWKKLPLF